MEKRYRYIIQRKNLREEFYSTVSIKSKFALFPKFVEGKFIWLKSYFSLSEVEGINFGNVFDYHYNEINRSFSIFSFRKELKELGVIKNIYQEKKSRDSWMENIDKVKFSTKKTLGALLNRSNK